MFVIQLKLYIFVKTVLADCWGEFRFVGEDCWSDTKYEVKIYLNLQN